MSKCYMKRNELHILLTTVLYYKSFMVLITLKLYLTVSINCLTLKQTEGQGHSHKEELFENQSQGKCMRRRSVTHWCFLVISKWKDKQKSWTY